MGVQDSYSYANELLNNHDSAVQAKHGRIMGDIITGETLIGVSHWLGNRRRVKMGLPPEPMSNAVAVPMAIGLGYLLWWVPFLVYMILATYVIHIHLFALLITVGIFMWAFRAWKKRRNKKYSTYYSQKQKVAWKEAVQKPANLHAPGSEEWLAEAGARMRKNILGH